MADPYRTGPNRVLDLLRIALTEERHLIRVSSAKSTPVALIRGFEVPPGSQWVHVLEKLTARNAGTVAFGTEAAQMIALGAEAVVLGPGDIRVAHQTGEFVPIDELERCVGILFQAIEFACL